VAIHSRWTWKACIGSLSLALTLGEHLLLMGIRMLEELSHLKYSQVQLLQLDIAKFNQFLDEHSDLRLNNNQQGL